MAGVAQTVLVSRWTGGVAGSAPGAVNEPYTLGLASNCDVDHVPLHGVPARRRIGDAWHILRKRIPPSAHAQSGSGRCCRFWAGTFAAIAPTSYLIDWVAVRAFWVVGAGGGICDCLLRQPGRPNSHPSDRLLEVRRRHRAVRVNSAPGPMDRRSRGERS